MTEAEKSNLFSIKTVAKLTGLTTHTLRAWENRYQAIVPDRSASGQRTYTLSDVERLRHLKKLTDFGYSISKVANEPIEKLRLLATQMETQNMRIDESVSQMKLSPRNAALEKSRYIKESDTLEELKIFEDLQEYRLEAINRKMMDARVALGARNFAVEVVLPLMREVGYLFASNKISIAQEHALSAIVRNHLGQIVQLIGWRTSETSPRVALATPPNDYHEIPILVAQVVCLVSGFQVNFLGPNMPAQALNDAVRALHCDILIIGATRVNEASSTVNLQKFIDELDPLLEKNQELWLGGSATASFTRSESSRASISILNDMHQLETALARYLEKRTQ